MPIVCLAFYPLAFGQLAFAQLAPVPLAFGRLVFGRLASVQFGVGRFAFDALLVTECLAIPSQKGSFMEIAPRIGIQPGKRGGRVDASILIFELPFVIP